MEEFGQWITSFDWNVVISAQTTSTKVEEFFQSLQNALDKYFPTRTVTIHNSDKPWMTPEIKTLIIQRQRAFNCGKLNIWKLLLNHQFIRLNIKIARSAFFLSSVLKLRVSNSRQWHKQIEKMTGVKCKQGVTLPGTSTVESANKINKQFTSIAVDVPTLDLDNLPAYFNRVCHRSRCNTSNGF